MASTCVVPARLLLSVDNCFEVNLLRVDQEIKCLYVRRVCDEGRYNEMKMRLTKAAVEEAQKSLKSVLHPLNMSTVYMIRTENDYLRAVLLKKQQSKTFLVSSRTVHIIYLTSL
ncbi:unnamed protein product [Thelazia callipaeda]|uniref:Ras-associating domain-containing protein n=1 Tax=Thelazia callipaeda TaxID=103827 RepID=A0A0N5D042_THECL|nr:unnamed protein product [Thelazia callipaeda]